MSRTKLIFVFFVIVCFSLSGYLLFGLFKEDNADSSIIKMERILTEVNSYKMTVEDFKEELYKLSPAEIRMVFTSHKRMQYLDDIIRKQILFQEAQKQKLNSDEDFIKTIRRYWEQALLKKLLEKKSKQISGAIYVYPYEIENYLAKMQEKIWARIVLLSDKQDAEQLKTYKNIEEGMDKVKECVIEYKGWKWYCIGDLNWSIEKVLFSLAEGEISDPVEIPSGWVVVEVGKKIKNPKVDFLLEEEVAKIIRKCKETEEMNKWIEKLCKQAKIKKNEKLLESLTLLDMEF